MTDPFLLGRILLNFKGKKGKTKAILSNLSAVAFTPDGSLWLGSDEFTHLERLTLSSPNHYKKHKRFNLAKLIDLPNSDTEEIDIEGLCYAAPYLWVTGSHSTKRKCPKKKDTTPECLKRVLSEDNRFLLARIPLDVSEPNNPVPVTEADGANIAWLPMGDRGNALSQAFFLDDYLKDFVVCEVPSKENGIDIEGLVVRDNKIFLGLRGPVLRGWAILLELEIESGDNPTELALKPIGPDGQPYKRHFLDLKGLGIRELCLQGDNLLVLAGPTMAMFGSMQVYNVKDIFNLSSDALLREGDRLELLFDLPFDPAADNAEGITLCSWAGKKDSLLVVYDSPARRRIVDSDKVYADVFAL